MPLKTAPRKILSKTSLAILLVTAGLLAAGCGSDSAVEPNNADEPQSAAPLELSLGEGDGLASCLAFDVGILADMSPAFLGTVTAADGEIVTLAVDRWYAGGDAATVVLDAPAGLEALIGGIDFQVDEQYNITAASGSVNYCGYSGPATAEYTAFFDQAFAS